MSKAVAMQENTCAPDLSAEQQQNNTPANNNPGASSEASEQTTHSSTGLLALVRHNASLSDALRLFGALGVATAMGLFLLEGVQVANDLYRFMTMLGLTVGLTAAGLLMSLLLNEQRGSRLFVSLGLLSVPVNFTVFGALIYSVIPTDIVTVAYPGFAHWTLSNASDIAFALIAGVTVLLPTVWLGFSVLARSERAWLSVALIIGCAFILIPVRQELWSAVTALASAAIVGWLVHQNHNESVALKTAEGRFSLALLFVAPIIIAVRSLLLYNATGVLIVAICAGIYLCTQYLLSARSDQGFLTGSLTVIAAVIALALSSSLASVFNFYLLGDWHTIIGTATLLLLALDIDRVSTHRAIATTASVLLVSIATLSLLLNLFFTDQALITAASTALLIGVSVYGCVFKRNALVGVAMTGVLIIIACNTANLWSVISQTGWWGIGAVGAMAIIFGSMLDRAGTVVEVKA